MIQIEIQHFAQTVKLSYGFVLKIPVMWKVCENVVSLRTDLKAIEVSEISNSCLLDTFISAF